MEGVIIRDGDVVVGDIDGVCIVPRKIENEVFARALEKARGERMVLKKIQEGMKARDAFDQYGIM
jgi:regulator of RNase E activity RraA